MSRQDLTRLGYFVTAKKTGAEYPNAAMDIGSGWEFVLTSPDGRDRGFSSHTSAWAFANRLAGQITA